VESGTRKVKNGSNWTLIRWLAFAKSWFSDLAGHGSEVENGC
jgi:hypothetical protein